MNLEDLVTHYGYIAIVLGTFLEGETILIIAGFLAHRGYLELPFVISAAFIGTLIGDQLYFYIGRIKGKQFIDNRPAWHARTERVFKLLEKHQTLLILGFRFLYGIRTVTPFVLGSAGINPFRYLFLNITGALVWAIALGIAGYYFGHALELLVSEVKKYEQWVIAGMLLTSMVVWFAYRLRDKKENCSELTKPDQ